MKCWVGLQRKVYYYYYYYYYYKRWCLKWHYHAQTLQGHLTKTKQSRVDNDAAQILASSPKDVLNSTVFTWVVNRQLQVKRRTRKVRQRNTDVLPLCYATNYLETIFLILQWTMQSYQHWKCLVTTVLPVSLLKNINNDTIKLLFDVLTSWDNLQCDDGCLYSTAMIAALSVTTTRWCTINDTKGSTASVPTGCGDWVITSLLAMGKKVITPVSQWPVHHCHGGTHM